jgi:hypothetical protein
MKDQHNYITELSSISKKHETDIFSEIHFFQNFSSFEGFPKRHPYDKGMILLFTDPFSEDTPFYEFPATAVGRIEELGTISREDGSTVIRVRLWLKKGTRGILSRSMQIE